MKTLLISFSSHSDKFCLRLLCFSLCRHPPLTTMMFHFVEMEIHMFKNAILHFSPTTQNHHITIHTYKCPIASHLSAFIWRSPCAFLLYQLCNMFMQIITINNLIVHFVGCYFELFSYNTIFTYVCIQ